MGKFKASIWFKYDMIIDFGKMIVQVMKMDIYSINGYEICWS